MMANGGGGDVNSSQANAAARVKHLEADVRI